MIGDGDERKGIDIIRKEYKRFLSKKNIEFLIQQESQKNNKQVTDYKYEESFFFNSDVRNKVKLFIEVNNKSFPKNKLRFYPSLKPFSFFINRLPNHEKFAVLVDNDFHGLLEGKLGDFLNNYCNPTDDTPKIITESKTIIVISEFNDLIESDKLRLKQNKDVFLRKTKDIAIHQISLSNLEEDLAKIFN